jgi:hypothetical protein
VREQQWIENRGHPNPSPFSPCIEKVSSIRGHDPAELPESGMCKVEWGCRGNEIAAAAAALMRIDTAEQVARHTIPSGEHEIERSAQAGLLGPEDARGLRRLCRRGDREVLVVARAYPRPDQADTLGAMRPRRPGPRTDPAKGARSARQPQAVAACGARRRARPALLRSAG